MTENQTTTTDAQSTHELQLERYLAFTVNEEAYATELTHICEIIAYQKPTRVPKVPRFLKGVINLRGSIIPLISVRQKFGLKEVDADADTSIIILEIEEELIGFIVDRVDDILAIRKDEIKDSPVFSHDIDLAFIEKVIDHNHGTNLVLDFYKVFEFEEIPEEITKEENLSLPEEATDRKKD